MVDIESWVVELKSILILSQFYFSSGFWGIQLNKPMILSTCNFHPHVDDIDQCHPVSAHKWQEAISDNIWTLPACLVHIILMEMDWSDFEWDITLVDSGGTTWVTKEAQHFINQHNHSDKEKGNRLNVLW